jgi:hypothetical protein
LPNAELSASTNVSGVVAIAGSFRVFIAVLVEAALDHSNNTNPDKSEPIDLPAFLPAKPVKQLN